MAGTASHPPFPSRPYTSGLGRTGGFQSTPYTSQTPFNAPPQNPGAFGTTGAAGAATTQQQREAQRLDRERQERQERERREAEERGVLDALSEEQREEVNEAVRISPKRQHGVDILI
jgi:centrin-3